jgi:hypothetical protein
MGRYCLTGISQLVMIMISRNNIGHGPTSAEPKILRLFTATGSFLCPLRSPRLNPAALQMTANHFPNR